MQKVKYNWREYKKLCSGKFLPENISVSFTSARRKTNPVIEACIEKVWADTQKGRLGVGLLGFRETVAYRLSDFSAESTHLALTLGETTYKDLQGTNATNSVLGDIYGKEYLANGILVQAIVITSDGHICFGLRSKGVTPESGIYAIFGGTLEKDEVVVRGSRDLFSMIEKELEEEIGVHPQDLENLHLFGIFEDWKYYPVLLFVAKLCISSQDLQERFARLQTDEHFAVECLPQEKIADIFDKEERYSDLTLVAIDFFRSEESA